MSFLGISFYVQSLVFGPCRLSEFTLSGPLVIIVSQSPDFLHFEPNSASCCFCSLLTNAKHLIEQTKKAGEGDRERKQLGFLFFRNSSPWGSPWSSPWSRQRTTCSVTTPWTTLWTTPRPNPPNYFYGQKYM